MDEQAAQLQLQRDKDIQAEIRLQEGELVKLERELKKKTDVEVRDMVSLLVIIESESSYRDIFVYIYSI